MIKFSIGQKKIVSDYLSNIGVAWFVAGVIGVFSSGVKNLSEMIVSFSWGVSLSLVFLRMSLFTSKGVRS